MYPCSDNLATSPREITDRFGLRARSGRGKIYQRRLTEMEEEEPLIAASAPPELSSSMMQFDANTHYDLPLCSLC
eukprot:747457-Hanusia_phi.AAC.3